MKALIKVCDPQSQRKGVVWVFLESFVFAESSGYAPNRGAIQPRFFRETGNGATSRRRAGYCIEDSECLVEELCTLNNSVSHSWALV